MTGNFIDKYVDMVIYNEFFIIDIETKVRSHILKNFPMRKVDSENRVDDNEDIEELIVPEEDDVDNIDDSSDEA